MRSWPAVLLGLLVVASSAYAELDSLPEVDSIRIRGSQEGQEILQDRLLQSFQRTDALSQEVQELRGQLEEQQHQLQQLRARLDEQGPSAPSAVQPQQQQSQDLTIPDKRASNAPNLYHSSSHLSESEQYRAAYAMLQDKNYNEAKGEFEALVQQYPHGEYTANAHYWLGEIYLSESHVGIAQESFRTVAEQFSSHPKASDALFKLGLVSFTQSDWNGARAYFDKVTTQYPSSAAASLARSKLEKMNSEGV